ncbi:MAG: CDP-alcohol phosphatidyltransferase family protein [Cytophagales bacterium]|nr:CDP-alcohol phosphatidyltransferase family protein [Cytophagales bacterium]
MKKEIPNLLTLGNLLAGCIGLWFVMQGDLVSASYCIFISLICDFFDGFLARALQAYSELGKQLDSLADMVSFGVLPAFILFGLVEQSCGAQCTVGLFGFYKPFMVFALVLMSGYRLAKFNIDTRQSDQFIGVPTPANGLLIASLPLILQFQPEFSSYILQFQGLLIYAVIMSYLMVCELPLLAFKFKTWDWKSNQVKFIFLIFCIAALVMLKFAAIPVLVIAYILLSGLIFLLNPNK